MPIFSAEQLKNLNAPFLLLAGEKDPFFDCETTLARARERIPGVVAERIDGTGHMFGTEQFDWIRARTLRFLADTSGKSAASG